jgi:hypothetical protein
MSAAIIEPAVSDYADSSIRGALLAVAEKAGGVVAPEAVVSSAADPDSPLHDLFEWDDSEAAAKFRLVQAGALIRRVKLHIVRASTETKVLTVNTTRAFVAPIGERRSKDHPEGGYAQVEKVLSDEDRKAALLATAKSELKALQQKYVQLVELAKVWKAIQAL